MTGVTAGLDKAMKSMNLEQISQVMDKFEKQFENLDVHSKVIVSLVVIETLLPRIARMCFSGYGRFNGIRY